MKKAGIKSRMLIFSLFCLFNYVFGQKISILKIDSGFIDPYINFILKSQLAKYDEYFIYTNRSSWTKDQHFYCLAYQKDKFKSVEYFVDFKTDHYTTQKKFKIKKRKLRIIESEAQELFNYFEKLNFGHLVIDSLFKKDRKINDTLTEVLRITDGSTDVFNFYFDNTFYEIKAYEIEYYQKKMPNQAKSVFILCRNKFFTLLQR